MRPTAEMLTHQSFHVKMSRSPGGVDILESEAFEGEGDRSASSKRLLYWVGQYTARAEVEVEEETAATTELDRK